MNFYGNLTSLLDPAIALFAGMVASLHCVAMCGPLSCALRGNSKNTSILGYNFYYHTGRLLSYSILGGVSGIVGGVAVAWLSVHPVRFLPWMFALFFLFIALGFDGFLTKWQARKGYGRSLVQKAYRLSGGKRGLAIGFVTPLIPCGPLYLVLWATTMTGNVFDGALIMAAYAMGTMPLLWISQIGWSYFSVKANPRYLAWTRRSLALLALFFVCMRTFMDVKLEGLLAGSSICF